MSAPGENSNTNPISSSSLLIEQIVRSLYQNLPLLQKKQILAGFDGFIDTLARPVQNSSVGSVGENGSDKKNEFFETIGEFGAYIAAHANRSTSVQYETSRKRMGGNMPNFVAALDALSVPAMAVGMLSDEAGAIDPIFAGLGKERFSFLAAGSAMAFEFTDGKIFFSPVETGGVIRGEKMFPRIEKAFPEFCTFTAAADLIAFLNWSELPFSPDLWEDVFIKALYPAPPDKTRFAFFDLSDTSAKSRLEIEGLISLLRKTGGRRATILSLNKNEAADINRKTGGKNSSSNIMSEIAESLYSRFCLDELVIHHCEESISLSPADGLVRVRCAVNSCPKVSTGAGDNFNAAYCFASLAGLPAAEKLIFANAYAAAYIASGSSPPLAVLLKETQ